MKTIPNLCGLGSQKRVCMLGKNCSTKLSHINIFVLNIHVHWSTHLKTILFVNTKQQPMLIQVVSYMHTASGWLSGSRVCLSSGRKWVHAQIGSHNHNNHNKNGTNRPPPPTWQAGFMVGVWQCILTM